MDLRKEIVDSLKQEIVGPSTNPIYRDNETGEEILLLYVHGAPKSRYGAGMLYPQQMNINEFDNRSACGSVINDQTNSEDGDNSDETLKMSGNTKHMTETGVVDEEPVGLANQYLPSALGFTVRLRNTDCNHVVKIEVKSAYYEKGNNKFPKKVLDHENNIVNSLRNGEPVLSPYWIRRPIRTKAFSFTISNVNHGKNRVEEKVLKQTSDGQDWLKLQIINRTTESDKKKGLLTYTFVIINSITDNGNVMGIMDKILYQNELILSTDNWDLIAPYEEKTNINDTTEEEELKLLYRKKKIFAIGHGTSVSWYSRTEKEQEKVATIYSSAIPVYDMPQIAPTSYVELSMFQLSDLGDWDIAKDSLTRLQSEYSSWIDSIYLQVVKDPELKEYSKPARSNINKCKLALERMKNGLNILLDSGENSAIVKSFRWMNKAMLWQQQRSKTRQRKWIGTGDKKNAGLALEGINGSENQKFASLKEFHDSGSGRSGRWRPFQIAFILMNIESVFDPDSIDRDIVDLIWFPTGGGKTEAYLGLAALTIFYRRSQGKKKYRFDYYGGTTILMRYTLRLLTTQQYERAASLICACELIRNDNPLDLGLEEISIGLWVGSASTPNSHKTAQTQYMNLQKNHNAPYNFIVMKCPCCGSQIGKIDRHLGNSKIKGLEIEDGNHGRVLFQCDNEHCEFFKKPLPLKIVDEYIYQNPPTLLLGTVDKFAMLTWKKEAGSLFGFRLFNETWKRIKPPELIIQDELHLISGPLGTMVGLYETMIQSLCNNYKKDKPPFIEDDLNCISPKIIASSATISRAYEQVKSLYGIKDRTQINIFPAQGINFGDTWFSQEKEISNSENYNGQEYPGRRYVGILASGYPSAQTSIVRAYSSVLQKVKELDKEKYVDYYWTLLGYFNSIRELGGASSLVYSDIRERLRQIQVRELIHKENKRYINRIQELTSRVKSSKIPETLKMLEEKFMPGKNNPALDICLATNMVATGVDIARLGLMFIHGQPKTTAEYIQASSRVGRDLPDGPGIIINLYSPSKPRDKSHYEQFQGYHSRIYSNVEPTSVTPFSINARERGLHAIFIGMIRHFSNTSLKENPHIIDTDFDQIEKLISKIILKRCEAVNAGELLNTQKRLEETITMWKQGFQKYGDAGNIYSNNNEGIYPLMYNKGAEIRSDVAEHSMPTPTSMRGVDTESAIRIITEE